MDSSLSIVESGESNRPIPKQDFPSKLKTHFFVIAIIVGLSGLAIGIAGLASYLHVGALSNMTQINALIMMAAGTGGGVIFLIIGIVGSVKNRYNDVQVDPESGDSAYKSDSAEAADNIGSVETHSGLVYGPEAWQKWNIEVLDAVSATPKVDLSKKDKILLYIPQRIRVNGEEKVFTLKAWKEISGGPFSSFDKIVEAEFGDSTAHGWVLIDKFVIPDSQSKSYPIQKQMVKERGYRLPSILEATVLSLMVFTFTGERLFGQTPLTFIRCAENVVVGGFGSYGLLVCESQGFGVDVCGAVGVMRFRGRH